MLNAKSEIVEYFIAFENNKNVYGKQKKNKNWWYFWYTTYFYERLFTTFKRGRREKNQQKFQK